MTGRRDRSLTGFSRRFQAGDRVSHGRALVGMAVLVVGIALIPLIDAVRTAIAARREEEAWRIAGPACAVVHRPSTAATSRRGVQTHRYGDIAYSRAFGAVSCAGFAEPGWSLKRRVYRVCQFNNPGAVTVTTPRERVTFEGTPGRPMTITVRDGRASCVLGGWFRARG